MTVLIDLGERQEVIAPDPPAPWRRVLLGAVGLVGLAMAAITWLVGTPPQPGVLVTDSSGLVSGIDPETGATRLTVTNGLASPDGSTVYRIEDTPTGDRIEIVDSTTGQVAASTPVDQGLRPAVVGVAGQAAVLVPAGETEDLLYAPRPREVTDLTVVWKDGRGPKTFHLEGNFVPETFTVDGDTLYLLDFQPATNPDHYFVRQLDLDTGQVTDVYSPDGGRVELNPEMRGRARAQVIHPDGTFMYTLYTVGATDPITDPEGETRYGFVHVISLTENWSHCIFLPLPMGEVESALSLTIDPNGENLWVVDGRNGLAAEVHTDSISVVRTIPLDERIVRNGSGARLRTAYSETTGRLFVANRYWVFAIDPQGKDEIMIWAPPAESNTDQITDLRLSEDSRQLWVISDDQMYTVDASSLEVMSRFELPGKALEFVGGHIPPVKFESIESFQCFC